MWILKSMLFSELVAIYVHSAVVAIAADKANFKAGDSLIVCSDYEPIKAILASVMKHKGGSVYLIG